MATSISSTFTLKDGFDLYQRIWTPPTTPKAHLIFLHGFSDQIDHYDAFFNTLLASYPIRVVSWDRRGWGKSAHHKPQQGNTGPMAQQTAELTEFINRTVAAIPDLNATPVFLMGHSMGGQETVYYMLNKQDVSDNDDNDPRPKIAGIVLESPYIGLDAAATPSGFKVASGRLASKFLPHFQITQPVQIEDLSPDPAVQKMYGDDPLCPGVGTLEAFRDMLERSAELCRLAVNPTSPSHPTLRNTPPCPALWTHGTADKLTDYAKSKMLCDSLTSCVGTGSVAAGGHKDSAASLVDGNKVFKSYEGWLHQLHNQPDGGRELYAKDVGDWIMLIANRAQHQQQQQQ